MIQTQFDKDIQQTLCNRTKLQKNVNLLYWYKQLYAEMFADIENIPAKKILEVGSGTSPLKIFYPHVLTSDIMPLDYLDYVFDAHNIDTFEPIADESLDIITLTNVLHHLQAPLVFFRRAAKKLKTGGEIIFTEPYFSRVSSFIYTYIHHESVDQHIEKPELTGSNSPLTTANIALPYLIFFGKAQWKNMLHPIYRIECDNVKYYTSLSYMLTGGLTLNTRIPKTVFVSLFWFDNRIARLFPGIFSSFFMLRIIKN
jgi:SAM-dependent methyltransferase